MPIELKIPQVGESITEVEVGEWLKSKGDAVRRDEPVVSVESDKATVEVPAPTNGVLTETLKKKGDKAKVGEVIALMEESAEPQPKRPSGRHTVASVAKLEKPAAMPAAQRAMAELGVRESQIIPTGPGGRTLKEDVLRTAEQKAEPPKRDSKTMTVPAPAKTGNRDEEIVRMTPMRRRIAERLVQAQQSAALLTTFNEIDMSAVNALRQKYKEQFLERNGTKLGFMSFFVKATVEALKAVPQVNAEVRGEDIVYRHYFDIGIAVGGGKGLVVPILRNAELMSFAEIERAISDFGKRAQENKIALEELAGGTFTISNGGVYGSLLSTPIVNPPQSGILGLHAIQDRPVALNGQVVIRPMMYVAMTYDHRIVDGREAVTFLKRIKDLIEEPSRILLEI